ncbi:hypothetical protein M2440_003467 [Methylorubrum extorquens]|nr:hypothetical protein [Methylorubrum extorquens]
MRGVPVRSLSCRVAAAYSPFESPRLHPHPEVPAHRVGLEGSSSSRAIPGGSFEAADAAPQDEDVDGMRRRLPPRHARDQPRKHDPLDPLRRRLDAGLAGHRLCPRRGHRRRDGRRAHGGCLRRRLPPAEPLSRDFRRGGVQHRLRAGLHPSGTGGRRGRRRALRRSRLHPDADRAGGFARPRAAGDAVDRAGAGARLLGRRGALCAGCKPDADHIPLPAVHDAGDAVLRHPQRASALRGRGRRAGAAQPFDAGGPRAGLPVPERGLCRGLGRLGLRRSAVRAGLVGCAPTRLRAAADEADPARSRYDPGSSRSWGPP